MITEVTQHILEEKYVMIPCSSCVVETPILSAEQTLGHCLQIRSNLSDIL